MILVNLFIYIIIIVIVVIIIIIIKKLDWGGNSCPRRL
jgi:hypothetical protein